MMLVVMLQLVMYLMLLQPVQVQSLGQMQGATVKASLQPAVPSSQSAFSNAICTVTQVGMSVRSVISLLLFYLCEYNLLLL